MPRPVRFFRPPAIRRLIAGMMALALLLAPLAAMAHAATMMAAAAPAQASHGHDTHAHASPHDAHDQARHADPAPPAGGNAMACGAACEYCALCGLAALPIPTAAAIAVDTAASPAPGLMARLADFRPLPPAEPPRA